jgi:hypothetical protein
MDNNRIQPVSIQKILIGFICLLVIWLIFLKKDSSYTEWSQWSSCSKLCGDDAIQTRTRKYIPGRFGGTTIDRSKQHLEETQNCTNLQPCKNGKYTEWRKLNLCTTNYKDDILLEERNYIPADPGGIDIPEESRILTKSTPCGIAIRPADDDFTIWTDISGSICRKDKNRLSESIMCGRGWKEQVRTYIPAKSGGKTRYNSNNITQWVECTAAKPICETRNGECTDWIFSGECPHDYAKFTRDYKQPIDGGLDNICANILTSNTLNNISYHCGKLEDTLDSRCMGPYNNQTKIITKRYTLPSKLNGLPIKPHPEEISRIFNSSTIDRFYQLSLNSSFTTMTNPSYTIKKIQENPNIIEFSYTEICPKSKLSLDIITNIWKNDINCNVDLGNEFIDYYDSNNYNNISNNENDPKSLIYMSEADVRTKLSKYNLDYILSKQNSSTNFDKLINMVSRCNLPSRIVTNNQNFKLKNILYPGLCYKNITLINENYRLVIGGSYNLALFHTNNLNTPYWSDSLSKSSNNYICMQSDGNLVVYKDNKIAGGENALWSSGTAGNDGAYLELTNHGFIIIKNKNNSVIWHLNISEISSGHFKTLGFYQLLKGGDEYLCYDRAKIYSNIAYSNEFIWTRDQFNLKIQNDGNLVMYKNNQLSGGDNAVWSTRTFGNNNAVLIMQNDGNLVLYPRNDTSSGALAHSRTSGNFGAGGYIEVNDQYRGHLIIWNSSNNKRIGTMVRINTNDNATLGGYRSLQSSGYIHLVGGDEFMLENNSLIYPYMRYSKEFTFRSSNDQYRLVMQSDGNLVLYNNINGSVMWSIRTFGNNNAILTSQTNGNLAVDTENFSTELWDIDRKKYGNIDRNIYQYGQIQDDGRFIYVKDNGKWEWIWDSSWDLNN